MAKKATSKAEKTVQDSQKKASAASTSSKSSGKKSAAKKPPAVKKNPKVSTEYENPISSGVGFAGAWVFYCVFVCPVCSDFVQIRGRIDFGNQIHRVGFYR